MQHVNPFDETFKRAIESKANGAIADDLVGQTDNANGTLLSVSKHLKDDNDTLHTPHIFPPVGENEADNGMHYEELPATESGYDLDLQIDEKKPEIFSDRLAAAEGNPETTEEGVITKNHLNLKLKLKSVINNNHSKKDACVQDKPLRSPHCKYTNDDCVGSRDMLRAQNRAAQTRCRMRKKIAHKKMESDLKQIQLENRRLVNGYNNLHQEYMLLKDKCK